MSAPAVPAGGASVLDRLQVLRFAPTPLRGAPAATWTQSPRTGVGQLPVPGTGLQPWLHDTTTTSTDPAGSTLATPDFGPKNGVHLSVVWKQWQRPRTRYRALMKRGVNRREAADTASRNRGPWRITITAAACWALPNAYSTRLAYLISNGEPLNQPNRRGTDPYARWCGRGGIARCPPIPIAFCTFTAASASTGPGRVQPVFRPARHELLAQDRQNSDESCLRISLPRPLRRHDLPNRR